MSNLLAERELNIYVCEFVITNYDEFFLKLKWWGMENDYHHLKSGNDFFPFAVLILINDSPQHFKMPDQEPGSHHCLFPIPFSSICISQVPPEKT